MIDMLEKYIVAMWTSRPVWDRLCQDISPEKNGYKNCMTIEMNSGMMYEKAAYSSVVSFLKWMNLTFCFAAIT